MWFTRLLECGLSLGSRLARAMGKLRSGLAREAWNSLRYRNSPYAMRIQMRWSSALQDARQLSFTVAWTCSPVSSKLSLNRDK